MSDMVATRAHRPLISDLRAAFRRLPERLRKLASSSSWSTFAIDRAMFVANRTGIREFRELDVLDADVILPLMSSGYEPGSTRRCAPSCQRRRLDRLARGAATQTGATAPTGGTGKRVPGP
jgi:hypothetical protein